ncbi:MAG: hypothetical protein AAF442_00070 [Pseudomonadota bacterium]
MTSTWVVVWCDTPAVIGLNWRDRLMDGLLRRFLKPGFRHVFCLKRLRKGGWIVINPHGLCIDVSETHGDAYIENLREQEKRGLCTMARVQAHRPEHWQRRGLLCCSSVIAHILGLRCGLWATPFELYSILSNQPITRS